MGREELTFGDDVILNFGSVYHLRRRRTRI